MPCVSEFYGISIYFYYNDHAPPHFHALYGNSEATFSVESRSILEGSIPRRVKTLVVEWANKHVDELNANWQLARQGLPLQPIAPLD